MSDYKELEKRFFKYLRAWLYRLSKWLIYGCKRWVKLGRERITVMLIPHLEKKIFTFQVSLFTGIFIALVLTGTVFSLLISTSRYKLIKKEMKKAILAQEQDIETLEKFEEEITGLSDNIAKYRGEMKEIGRLLGRDQMENLFLQEQRVSEKMSLNTIGRSLSQDDFVNVTSPLRIVRADFSSGERVLKDFKKFLEAREEIIQKIPTGWPVIGGGYITSPFGIRKSPFTGNPVFHGGVDIGWWPGTPIRASADGVVVFAGMKGGYGRTVQIQHDYGFQTLYAHCSGLTVYEGKEVKKGEIIGFMGRTGRATGYNVHYEVRIGTKPIDPIPFVTVEF